MGRKKVQVSLGLEGSHLTSHSWITESWCKCHGTYQAVSRNGSQKCLDMFYCKHTGEDDQEQTKNHLSICQLSALRQCQSFPSICQEIFPGSFRSLQWKFYSEYQGIAMNMWKYQGLSMNMSNKHHILENLDISKNKVDVILCSSIKLPQTD